MSKKSPKNYVKERYITEAHPTECYCCRKYFMWKYMGTIKVGKEHYTVCEKCGNNNKDFQPHQISINVE